MVKLRYTTADYGTHVLESTVGFDENRQLRMELDKLHEEYNRIIDEKNHEYAQNFQQAPRKSGYGQKRIVEVGQPKEVRVSQYSNS